jgi:hypothetical protein
VRIVVYICLFCLAAVAILAQEGNLTRGSIPEDLLRPGHGESSRFPIDTVIGELGQGRASSEAFAFANSVARRLLAGDAEFQECAAVLESAEPRSFRIGGGRDEADGSVSFMIRFIGRELSITGELFIRYATHSSTQVVDEETAASTTSSWMFEDLILEAARSREEELRDSQLERARFDFSPYERFF